MLHEGGGSRLTTSACYSQKLALSFGLEVAFCGTQDGRWIREKGVETDGMKDCVTNDETFRWVVSGCSTSKTLNLGGRKLPLIIIENK